MEWWNYILVIIGAAVGTFIGSLLREEGRALSIRKRLDTVTKIVEEIKHQLGKEYYTSTAKWEKKFDVLQRMGLPLKDIRTNITGIAKLGSEFEAEEPRMDRHVNSVRHASERLVELAEKNKLLVAKELYDRVKQLDVEVIGMHRLFHAWGTEAKGGQVDIWKEFQTVRSQAKEVEVRVNEIDALMQKDMDEI